MFLENMVGLTIDQLRKSISNLEELKYEQVFSGNRDNLEGVDAQIRELKRILKKTLSEEIERVKERVGALENGETYFHDEYVSALNEVGSLEDYLNDLEASGFF